MGVALLLLLVVDTTLIVLLRLETEVDEVVGFVDEGEVEDAELVDALVDEGEVEDVETLVDDVVELEQELLVDAS